MMRGRPVDYYSSESKFAVIHSDRPLPVRFEGKREEEGETLVMDRDLVSANNLLVNIF
jgi:hypothetical protein